MIVYRITGSKYTGDPLGSGGATHGGRWNKKGTPTLYTGINMEIAILETIVHTPPMLVPNLDVLAIEIPDLFTELKIEELPPNWTNYPAPSILAEIAEDWVMEGKTIALKVPSCVIRSSFNFILNCRHPEYLQKVKILDRKSFHFDSRLTG